LADVILKLGLFERYNHSMSLRSNYLNFVVCKNAACLHVSFVFLTSS
jgi:hypothetical protein